MPEILDRRRLIAGGAAGLAACALPVRAATGAYPFTLGIAAGSPSADGFVIWTRLAPDPLAPDGQGGMSGPAQVAWEVAEDEAFTAIAAQGQTLAAPEGACAVHVEVAGLRPGRAYWYRFTAMGEQSPAGRAKTAPPPGEQPAMRLAFASCAHWEVGWFSAYRQMALENPDLVVFLGDYIYEYGYAASRAGLVRRYPHADECRTLAQFRNRYAIHKTDADLQRLHAAAACVATWDDHEVQNDYGGDFSQIGTIPQEEFRLRRLAAYQAFYEHMPLRPSARPAADGSMRLHGRQTFGNLFDLTVLDVRQYRSVQPCPVGGSRRGRVAACADLADPARTMLGQAQEAWLHDSFRSAERPWNLIAQGLLLSPYLQSTTAGAPGYFTDGWSGYGANRARMLGALEASGRRNAVFFGGDLHAFAVSDVKADFADPAAPAIASEFVATSITSDRAPDSFFETLDLNPHIRHFDNAWRGYLSVDLSAQRMTTRLRAITDRIDPNAGAFTLKAFAVEAGRPGVQPA